MTRTERTRALWALGGGLLGGLAVVGYLALRKGKDLERLGTVETERIASRTAEQYLAQQYGLTPQRIRRLGEYGELVGA